MVDARVDQHKAGLWAWVVAELASRGYWGHLPQARGRASSHRPGLQGQFSLARGEGWGHLFGVGGAAILLQYPVRVRASEG